MKCCHSEINMRLNECLKIPQKLHKLSSHEQYDHLPSAEAQKLSPDSNLTSRLQQWLVLCELKEVTGCSAVQNLPSDLVLAAKETLTTANSKAITARNAHDEVVAFLIKKHYWS